MTTRFDGYPTEHAKTDKKSDPMSRRLIGAAAVVALGAGIAGAAIQRQADGVDKLKTDLARTTQALGNARAGEYSAALYNEQTTGSVLAMPIINGKIDIKDNVTGNDRSITREYPILLATKESSNTPNPVVDKNFLDGATIGIITHDANGRVIIISEAFDPEHDTFTPYDAAHLLLPETTGVYISKTYNGKIPGDDILIAVDESRQTTLNGYDGHTIQPGQTTGLK